MTEIQVEQDPPPLVGETTPSGESSMRRDVVDRAIRTAFLVTVLLCPFFAVYIGGMWAVGFTLASFWSTINLWLISLVFREYFGGQRWPRLVVFLGVKFPLLYGLGFWGLSQRAAPMGSVLVGFHMIFFVLVLKVVSRGWFAVEDKTGVSMDRDVPLSGNEERV